MPHFISKNMFLDVNSAHNDFFIMPYFTNISHPNIKILPVVLETKLQNLDSNDNKNLESKNLQNTESRFYKNNEFSNLDSKKLQNLDSKSKVIFIRCVCRNDTFLYKIDKITQIRNLAKLKEILSFLASKTQVISHNLAPSKKHSKGAESAFLLKGCDLQNLKPQFIEIGFGSGRHILNLAKNYPNKIILGFEIHTPSIRQVLNAIKLQNLSNLYICALDARSAIELIESSVVERIFVHFPVPWNSAKHRRVINPEFLQSCFRILGRAGLLHLRSDDFTYVRDSIDELLGLKCADFSVRKNASSEVISKYEARWSRQKKDIFDLFIKKPLDYCEDLSVESENFAFDFDFTITDLRAFCNQKWVDSKNKTFISLGDIYELQNIESRFYENNEIDNLDSKEVTESTNKDSKKTQNLDSKDSKENIESKLQNLDSINSKNAAVQIIELTLGSFQVPFNTYLIIKSKESNETPKSEVNNEAPKSQTNNTTKETTKSNENHASKANQESQVKNTSKETQESQVKNTTKANQKTQTNNANKETPKTKQPPKSYTLSYLNAPLNIKSHKLAHIFLCKILNNKLDSNIIH